MKAFESEKMNLVELTCNEVKEINGGFCCPNIILIHYPYPIEDIEQGFL